MIKRQKDACVNTYIHTYIKNVYTGVPRTTEVDTMRPLLLQVS